MLEERGIPKESVETWINTGVPIEQASGQKYAFVTKDGVAIVRADGKLITAWSSEDFDEGMLEIIQKLFGGDE